MNMFAIDRTTTDQWTVRYNATDAGKDMSRHFLLLYTLLCMSCVNCAKVYHAYMYVKLWVERQISVLCQCDVKYNNI